jgi:hypothetical protein
LLFNSNIKTLLSPRPYLNCLSQDDPALISALLADYIKEPDMTADYNFTVPVEDLIEGAGGYGLPIDVDELVFKHQLKNGFFIEAGAGGGSLSIDNIIIPAQLTLLFLTILTYLYFR